MTGVLKWMKDPASVQFRGIEAVQNSRGQMTVCGEVNGRTSAEEPIPTKTKSASASGPIRTPTNGDMLTLPAHPRADVGLQQPAGGERCGRARQ